MELGLKEVALTSHHTPDPFPSSRVGSGHKTAHIGTMSYMLLVDFKLHDSKKLPAC